MTSVPSSAPPQQNAATTEYDVIIIGAGHAGLAAAYRLAITHKRTVSVLVLEASDHVGGRTRNLDLGTGRFDGVSDDSYELGGTWLSPQHTAVLGLSSELGLDVFDTSTFLGGSNSSEDGDLAVRMVADMDNENNHNHNSVLSRSGDDSHEEEWPWWYWGADYSDEGIKRLQRIILHLQPPPTLQGMSRKVAFQTPLELLQALDEPTRTELEAAGKRIDADAQALGDGNCWKMPSVGTAWANLDARSTSDTLLKTETNNTNTNGLLTTPDARSILRNVIRDKNADDPDRVSYLYNLISFKGCNSDGADCQYRVRGGTQAIPVRIADLLNNNTHSDECCSTVLLNSPVQCVRVFDNCSGTILQLPNDDDGMDAVIAKAATKDVRVEVETHDGRTYMAKAAIITGAPPIVSKISFTPDLPNDQRRLLLEQMPMGRSMKFAAVYNRGPWWRQHGLQGDILASGLPKELSIPGGEVGELLPLFGCCFDLSPYSRKVGVLSCFLEGSSYNYFASLSKDRQQELMRAFLRLTFDDLIIQEEDDDDKAGDDDGKPLWEPDGFVVGDWGPENPFVGGAYTSYFPPGVLSDPVAWKAYRQQEKLPNVFLAGADYHAGFGNGYVEGAVRSGQQAADLILQRILVENSK